MIQHVRLEDLCTIQSGGTPSRRDSTYWGGGIPWVKISDIDRSQGNISETEETITEAGLAAIRNRMFDTEALLFAMYGSVGKTARITRPMSTNQAILGIKIKDESKLAMSFLQHWLKSRQSSFENDARGVAQKNLSAGYMRELVIPLPPLEEQKRVAAILDKADAIRRKRQQALAMADQFLRSAFLDMFGQPDATWPIARLADLAENTKNSIRTGPFGSQLLHSEFTDSGIPVLGIDNAVNNNFEWGKPRFISQAKYESLSRYTVKPKDVLITIMGTCGRCAIVPDNIPLAINTKHLCCITFDQTKIVPEYVHSFFLQHPMAMKYLKREAKGAVMDGLNMGIIKELPIPVPPMETQTRFRELTALQLNFKATSTLYLEQASMLFSSISQSVFDRLTAKS